MDVHALKASERAIALVFHIPVPNENNEAGKSLKDCVMEDASVPKTTVLPDDHITTDESNKIANGELIEEVVNGNYNSNHSYSENLVILQNFYAIKKPEVQDRIRNKYKWWGRAENFQ